MTEAHQDGRRVEVRDDPDQNRYVIEVDGEIVGKAVYHMRGGRHFFVHTEVDEGFEGRGLGTSLVKEALDSVRAKDGTVVPICPLFAAYIERHPGYDDLVDHEIMARVNQSIEKNS